MTTFAEDVETLLINFSELLYTDEPDDALGRVQADILNLVSERIIGDNEEVVSIPTLANNDLRRRMRTTLYEGTKKDESNE